MILLLGAIGWGLLTIGAVTHLWHFGRLRELLALHLDHELPPAVALVTTEMTLGVALPLIYLGGGPGLQGFAVAALVLAAGFFVWIARLLATESDLPCACSFSDAPTTRWSLARSACVGLVGLFGIIESPADNAQAVATLAVGLACAGAIFVTPEAVAWPAPSRALMARVDAHKPTDTAAP